jgi:subtilisin family serine protease
MRHAVRPWLLAAGLPLFFGPAVGCVGNDEDAALTEDLDIREAAQADSLAGQDLAAGAPGVAGDKAPGKPRSYVRDIRGTFQEEPGLEGEHTYIVHFADAPLAMYEGGIPGLAATSPAATGFYGKLDAKSARSQAYKSFLLSEQGNKVQAMQQKLGRTVKVMRQYTNAVNAVTARMTQDEARELSFMPGVAFVERDQAVWPSTDRGPLFIGAQGIWDGSATGVPSQGEGITVGIIDSGLAIQVEIDGATTHHPSFDAIGEDGYVHTNPLGEGNYLGGCVQHPEWCNSKVIGVYSFLQGQPNPGVDPAAPTNDVLWRFKDTSGHGSHVASTAAGNVLFNVPAIDAEGNPSTFQYGRISGVAPHANLVAYKVCAPSCFFSDIAAAVEQAIEDGVVDVLNQSIGNSGGSPWNSTSAQAFLSARAAGIFVAASAGNDGPTAGTAGRGNSAPWVAGVAALSHDRRFPNKQLTELSGGATTPPPTITGLAITGGFTGRIVYAGNFRVGNPGEPNFEQPQQCLAPFPPGTFAPDMIVMCDRGTAARTDKGRFVRAGGAGGFILANVPGGSNTVDADAHVLPAINVNIAQGTALRNWLATGTGHRGTITPSQQPVADVAVADIMASFSSRGPYSNFDILAPNVAAPGLAIFAAGAQILFQHPGAPSVRGLFGTIQGTSMASPHVAGSAALMKSIHPDWTDAEILSAFMTTGNTVVRKENGVTPANPFDYGGGRVRLGEAARVGLVFDQPASGFVAANPAIAGNPLQLNVAALVEDTCIAECSWTRTVRATRSATWNVTSSPFVTVTPSTFTLSENQTQTLTITARVDGMPLNTFVFGTVTLTSTTPALPVQTMQLVTRPAKSNIGRAVAVRATRNAESVTVTGLRAITIPALSTRTFGLGHAQRQSYSAAQDPTTNSPYDNLAGVTVQLVDFPDLAEQFIAETLNSTSLDLDLWVGLDQNGDGLPSQNEEVCVSATSSANERCTIELGGTQSGRPRFWVLVQNFRSSVPGGQDTFQIATTAVRAEQSGIRLIAPTAVPGGQNFEARVAWNLPMQEGEVYYGRVGVYADATLSAAAFLGNVDVRIERGPDDVKLTTPPRVAANEAIDVTLRVQPNFTAVNRVYDIEVPLPTGVKYIKGSGGTFDGDSVNFRVTRIPTTPAAGQVQTLKFRAQITSVLKGQLTDLAQLNTVNAPDTAVESNGSSFNVQAYTFLGYNPPVTEGATIKIGQAVQVSFNAIEIDTKQPVFFGFAFAQVINASGVEVRNGIFNGFLGRFTFVLDTTGLAPGQYTIRATLDDGFSYDLHVKLVP